MHRRGPSWTQRFEKHARRNFADAADRYLKAYQGKDKRRVAYAVKWLIPYLGDVVLMDVNDEALEQFKHDRLNGFGAFEKKSSAGTVNYEIGLVSTILNAACREWEWIPRTLKLKRVKGPRRQPHPMTWDQQDALFAELPQHWAEGVILFGFNTGAREQEILGLRWKDEVEIHDLSTSVFMLYDQDVKNDEARPLILNSLSRLAVDRQRDNGSEYVFPSCSNRSAGERMATLWDTWDGAWKRAGLPTDFWTRRGPHNMRHTYLHRLRVAGVSEEDRAALAGHGTTLEQDYAWPELEKLIGLAELATIRERTRGVILRRKVA
jgi:integrase